MESTDTKLTPPKWFSIQEAAAYLDIAEPTLYRWMRDGQITFRKVGDSTRFWKQDLDEAMEVHPSEREVARVKTICPACHHDELVEGEVHSTGLSYFRPRKTKFWTMKDANIVTTSRMCPRCGAITWFGDTAKLNSLRDQPKSTDSRAKPAGSSKS